METLSLTLTIDEVATIFACLSTCRQHVSESSPIAAEITALTLKLLLTVATDGLVIYGSDES